MIHPTTALRTVKVVHSVAWAFFVGCILANPYAAFRSDFRAAAILIAVVSVEVAILVVNRMRCPLTGVAARYTDERQDNFDIYLPLWLARYNKHIFGTVFVAAVLYTVARWQDWIP